MEFIKNPFGCVVSLCAGRCYSRNPYRVGVDIEFGTFFRGICCEGYRKGIVVEMDLFFIYVDIALKGRVKTTNKTNERIG